MKKLIILSAIALSSLIYSSANAQERFDAGSRYTHEDHRAHRLENRERREYVQPVYHNYRTPVVERYRADERFYPGYRHDSDIHYRERR